MEAITQTKSDIKAGIKHPVALFVFGMLFAAFLFPMVAMWLGKIKAKGGAASKLIPMKFTRTA